MRNTLTTFAALVVIMAPAFARADILVDNFSGSMDGRVERFGARAVTAGGISDPAVLGSTRAAVLTRIAGKGEVALLVNSQAPNVATPSIDSGTSSKGAKGTDVQPESIAEIPEPAGYALLIAGIALLAMRRLQASM